MNLGQFLLNLKKSVLHQKEAFPLSGLLNDIKRLSNENGLEDALIGNTCTLKSKIAERFPDDMSYYSKSKYLIVHCSDMIPCEYAIAVLKGNPAGNCMFKVNNRNTRARCEICSKLTIKTPERR